jgi:hypothetical protein
METDYQAARRLHPERFDKNGEPRMIPITVKIQAGPHRKLEGIMKDTGMTRSQVITQMILRWGINLD